MREKSGISSCMYGSCDSRRLLYSMAFFLCLLESVVLSLFVVGLPFFGVGLSFIVVDSSFLVVGFLFLVVGFSLSVAGLDGVSVSCRTLGGLVSIYRFWFTIVFCSLGVTFYAGLA